MSTILTTRCHRLAASLAELKVKVRAALATELAGAVGTAVRDVLVVALVDRLVAPGPQALVRPSVPRVPGWRDDGNEPPHDEWSYPRDPWDEPDGDLVRPPSRCTRDEPENVEPVPAVPAAAAVAVGVNVGRWWLARKGTAAAAVGLGGAGHGPGARGRTRRPRGTDRLGGRVRPPRRRVGTRPPRPALTCSPTPADRSSPGPADARCIAAPAEGHGSLLRLA